MRNNFRTTIKVTRGEICDLLLACLAAKEMAPDSTKWDALHDKLKAQLEELDEALDEAVYYA